MVHRPTFWYSNFCCLNVVFEPCNQKDERGSEAIYYISESEMKCNQLSSCITATALTEADYSAQVVGF